MHGIVNVIIIIILLLHHKLHSIYNLTVYGKTQPYYGTSTQFAQCIYLFFGLEKIHQSIPIM